jgi:hypothetical protein
MSFAFAHQRNMKQTGDGKTPTLAKHTFPHRHRINNLNRDSLDFVFHLQRSIGNQAVQSIVRSNNNPKGFDFAKIGILQPKPKVSHPRDAYEQEADRVAEQVMRMSTPSVSTARRGARDEEKIDRKCTNCEMKEKEEEEDKGLKISRKTSSVSDLDTTDEIMSEISDVVAQSGSELDYPIRQFMESGFSHNFGNVRVHSDASAAESARAVNARAYTVGTDIVFGEGEYNPKTFEGKKLIAHELAHVLQQNSGTSVIHRKIQFDSPKFVPDVNPIEKTLTEQTTPGSAKPSLGLTTPTVKGVKPRDLNQARELIFQALEPKLITYNEKDRECTFADFDVKISAHVSILIKPDGNKWTMKVPRSRVKHPLCDGKGDDVQVVMIGKPSSEHFGKWIQANEQEHVDDLKNLYGKHLEPHFKWLLSLKEKSDDDKRCQEDLLKA